MLTLFASSLGGCWGARGHGFFGLPVDALLACKSSVKLPDHIFQLREVTGYPQTAPKGLWSKLPWWNSSAMQGPALVGSLCSSWLPQEEAIAADLVYPPLSCGWIPVSQRDRLLGIHSRWEIWGNPVPVLRKGKYGVVRRSLQRRQQ